MVTPVAPLVAATATTNPSFGPVSVASHPVYDQALAPTPPSREEDDTEDHEKEVEGEVEGEDEHEDEDENEKEDEAEAVDVDYDDRVVKTTGIPLRERSSRSLRKSLTISHHPREESSGYLRLRPLEMHWL